MFTPQPNLPPSSPEPPLVPVQPDSYFQPNPLGKYIGKLSAAVLPGSFEGASAGSYKLVLCGAANVGKTCLLRRIVSAAYPSSKPEPTVGVEYARLMMRLDDQPVEFSIWDTAGQERYDAMTRSYFRGAHGVICIYDITNYTSFETATRYIEIAQEDRRLDPRIMMVGNKSDLSATRGVPFNVAKELCERNNFFLFEASALSGHNVDEATAVFTEYIHNWYRAHPPKINLQRNVTLGASAPVPQPQQQQQQEDTSSRPKACAC